MKCYLCRSQVRAFIQKNGYQITQCPNCGLKETVLGQPYDSFIQSYYSEGYFTGESKYAAYTSYKKDKWFIEKNMKKYLAAITKYKPRGKLLDVGCAMGYLVGLAVKKGYDAYGFDASEYAVGEGKNRLGERITHGTVQSITYPKNSFDIISLFDVVEHLGDPIKDLTKLSTFLKKDGMMIMATGDIESVTASILKRKWTFYIPPQHIFFFSQKTLSTVLEKSGFIPMHWFRVGKWLSLQYVTHLARSTGESRLAHWFYPLVERTLAGRMPLYLPLGDNMVVIARKK